MVDANLMELARTIATGLKLSSGPAGDMAKDLAALKAMHDLAAACSSKFRRDSDQHAEVTLQRLAARPDNENRIAALADVLEDKLSEDAAFAEEVRGIMETIARESPRIMQSAVVQNSNIDALNQAGRDIHYYSSAPAHRSSLLPSAVPALEMLRLQANQWLTLIQDDADDLYRDAVVLWADKAATTIALFGSMEDKELFNREWAVQRPDSGQVRAFIAERQERIEIILGHRQRK